MNRLIIVGSPRTDGRSAHLANMLFETCIEECPDDELALAPVSTLSVAGCMGCDACRDNIAKLVELGEEALEDDFAPCVIDDDMQEIYELIDSADEITVVSPVYFAGPPSQLKALLDRLQPYYWTNARAEEKRPAVLHVVGEGGDPHGFSALVSCVRSALAVAGFRLETVFDWVGKIDNDGEITAEAEVQSIEDFFAAADSAVAPAQDAEGDRAAIIEFPQVEGALSPSGENSPEAGSSRGPRGGARTKLSLDAAEGSSASRSKGKLGTSQKGGKQQGSRSGGSHSGGLHKSGGTQGKRGGQQGGARTKGAAKKGAAKKGNSKKGNSKKGNSKKGNGRG